MDRLRSGYGGTVRCELDRELGFGQVAPPIVLHARLSPHAPAGVVVNTATATAVEVPGAGLAAADDDGDGLGDLVTLSLEDSAAILTPGPLAVTGGAPALGALAGLALILLGGAAVAIRRRRDDARASLGT